MQEPYRDRSGSIRLTFLVMSVTALAFFCLAAPSAKAQTYDVTITGGSGGGCTAGDTAQVTINSATDTIEFLATSGSGCYFGGVGASPTAGTTVTTYGYGPTGAGECLTNCSDLSTLTASTDITFQGDDVGACSTTAKCTTSENTFNDQLQISDAAGGFFTTSSAKPDVIASSSNGGANSPVTVDFDDPVPVPEAPSYLLFGSGLLGLGAIFRKKLGRVG
jgi:hypothetical protein